MKTKEELAEIARQNGAKSKGPKSETGKRQSSRNAIIHGERATALKLFVPPHSALLVYEDRLAFYKLYDTNIAKYQPLDEHENAVVREITDLQWSNLRARLAIHTMLNCEILTTGPAVEPVIEENRSMENIIAAYDSLNKSITLKNFHQEYALNTRLIGTLERRLILVQRRWPSKSATVATSDEERKFYGAEKDEEDEKAPEPTKGTQDEEPQTTDNKATASKKRVKIINVHAPLTEEKIRLYKQVFPNRDIQFNVFEPPQPNPKAA